MNNKVAAETARERISTNFKIYFDNLAREQTERLDSFFASFDRHCLLRKEEKSALRNDFENALLYYSSVGIPLDEALGRLDTENMGGFYSRPPVMWYSLDDAAKIYPLSMNHGRMAIFRLSAYMTERVIPEILQMALNFMIKRFPSFATTVKKGFFWHYLDTSKRRYPVTEEADIPCRPLPISHNGAPAFRVIYYNNRISVEYFHILTDGTGGVVFLKTLIAEYLRLLGKDISTAGIPDINEPPLSQETANEFHKAEIPESSGGFMEKSALQMSGQLSKIFPCQILHFKMPANRLKEVSSKKSITVTEYVLSKMFLAAKYSTDEPEGELSIQVPVNMRKFYPSQTIRNFSMYCGIRVPISDVSEGEELERAIKKQLSEKSSKISMSAMMNSTKRMVDALRYVPLTLKTPAARLMYSYLGDGIFTSTLSNLGVVNVPPDMEKYIESMDFVLGASCTNRASCALITFRGVSTLSITKMTQDPSFEDKLYKLLQIDGIELEVEGSPLYEG